MANSTIRMVSTFLMLFALALPVAPASAGAIFSYSGTAVSADVSPGTGGTSVFDTTMPTALSSLFASNMLSPAVTIIVYLSGGVKDRGWIETIADTLSVPTSTQTITTLTDPINTPTNMASVNDQSGPTTTPALVSAALYLLPGLETITVSAGNQVVTIYSGNSDPTWVTVRVVRETAPGVLFKNYTPSGATIYTITAPAPASVNDIAAAAASDEGRTSAVNGELPNTGPALQGSVRAPSSAEHVAFANLGQGGGTITVIQATGLTPGPVSGAIAQQSGRSEFATGTLSFVDIGNAVTAPRATFLQTTWGTGVTQLTHALNAAIVVHDTTADMNGGLPGYELVGAIDITRLTGTTA